MGATSITLFIDKKASISEIEKAFKNQRDNDQERNGHQEGYSGDFQTVNKVNFGSLSSAMVFASEELALEHCLKYSEKWTSVVAVYYVNLPETTTNKIEKLKNKRKVLNEKLTALNNKVEFSNKPFKKCNKCLSKVAVKWIRNNCCPVCDENLQSQGTKNKIKALTKKLEENLLTLKKLAEEQQSKQLKYIKDKDIKTLVAGWGAC